MLTRHPHRASRRSLRHLAKAGAALIAPACLGLLAGPGLADASVAETASGESIAQTEITQTEITQAEIAPTPKGLNPIPVQLETIRYLTVTTFGEVLRDEIVEINSDRARQIEAAGPVLLDPDTGELEPRGSGPDCTFVASHSTPPFTSGQFNAQAGFVEDEWAIQSYTIPSGQFPVQINEVAQLFVTSNAIESTTTRWSFGVWTGTPTAGTLEFIFSSDDVILPNLTMPPGTNGTVVSVVVDPSDPEQIILTDNGSSTFSIGFRVDEHNAQTGDGCLGSIQLPSNRNAFPATDTDGLAVPAGNWLGIINCGPLGCPPGFSNFQSLPFLCTPTGDWAMSTTWTTLNCVPGLGACCDSATGNCSIQSQAACDAIGGNYQGDNTDCATANCPQPTVACCFASTGGCLDLTVEECMLLNGVPGATGSSCATTVCFPEGACCLPDGTCQDGLSPEDCAALSGVFQGDGTTCATTNCPEPVGGCCVGDGCVELSESDCAVVSGSWRGPGSSCDDCVLCPADWNADDNVNILDVVDFISDWNAGSSFADINDDGALNILDVVAFIALWNAGC